MNKGDRVKVDFIGESATIYSGKRFTGYGVLDRVEDGRVFGRLDDGTPFMCLCADVEVVGMSDFEKWFRSLNANGKTVYFLGNEHKVSEMAWNHQQAKIEKLENELSTTKQVLGNVIDMEVAKVDNLKTQLNNMEACYIEKKKQVEGLQTENTELQEVVLRDSALATKAQLERNEWQEVVKSQQKTIENLSVRHEVLNIQVDPAHQLKLTEKVSKEISRGSRLTKHRIDLRGAND